MAATPMRQSLLESLDDSDDDFGGPPPLLSPAVIPQPVQADAASDTATWQMHWLAASSTACVDSLAERRPGLAPHDAHHSTDELRQRSKLHHGTVQEGRTAQEWSCALQALASTPDLEVLVTA